jgi:DNA-binding response OmpR family regulator
MAKKKILIVDDEIDFTELMKTRLEANDFEVVVANNGESALEMVKTAKPDAVLLDIMMPGIDGLTVLKRIRATDESLPIFMITAFSNEERIKLAGKLNASGFIIKARNDISEEIKNISDAIDVANKYKEKRG